METSFKYEVQIAVFEFNYTIYRRCIQIISQAEKYSAMMRFYTIKIIR